jgi:hypothetical protein
MVTTDEQVVVQTENAEREVLVKHARHARERDQGARGLRLRRPTLPRTGEPPLRKPRPVPRLQRIAPSGIEGPSSWPDALLPRSCSRTRHVLTRIDHARGGGRGGEEGEEVLVEDRWSILTNLGLPSIQSGTAVSAGGPHHVQVRLFKSLPCGGEAFSRHVYFVSQAVRDHECALWSIVRTQKSKQEKLVRVRRYEDVRLLRREPRSRFSETVLAPLRVIPSRSRHFQNLVIRKRWTKSVVARSRAIEERIEVVAMPRLPHAKSEKSVVSAALGGALGSAGRWRDRGVADMLGLKAAHDRKITQVVESALQEGVVRVAAAGWRCDHEPASQDIHWLPLKRPNHAPFTIMAIPALMISAA